MSIAQTGRIAGISCTVCSAPLPERMYNSGKELPCGSCGALLVVEVFPALFRESGTARTGEAITIEGEASCYYHSHKRAVAICASCGRFICSLCETELAGSCLCPSCIDLGRQNEELETLVTQRTLHDSLALSIALLPMLFFPVTIISAPIVIYLVIRHWKKPGSILPRTKIRLVCAFLIALAQISGWLMLLFTKLSIR